MFTKERSYRFKTTHKSQPSYSNVKCLIAQLIKSCLRDTFTGANLGSNPIGRITFTRLSMEKNVSEPKKIEYNMKFGHTLS